MRNTKVYASFCGFRRLLFTLYIQSPTAYIDDKARRCENVESFYKNIMKIGNVLDDKMRLAPECHK